ncbi:MAG TPA: serine hydrolase [Paludibaculum sp.]|jgi:CubicO group peptidase (beta-lactamase class C family)
MRALTLMALTAFSLSAQTIDTTALDAAVEKVRATFLAPGIAVGLVHGNEVIYLKGFGVKRLGGNEAVTPDTRFAIASTTKAFTSMAAAMLVDDGKMQWEDHPGKHLAGFRLADAQANALVTMRDILSHRTGLSRNDVLWTGSGWTRAEILRHIAEVPLTKPFRANWQYQNIMFMAAGEAVGQASGGTWEMFLGTRILSPLGMSNTGFNAIDAQRAADVASPHLADHGAVKEGRWHDVSNIGSAGSMNSSVRDMTKWLRLQMSGGVYEGQRLVSEKSLRETHSPQMVVRDEAPWGELNPESNLRSYGMGWFVQDYRGRQLISHGGAIDGFRAQAGFLPKEQIGFIILTNVNVASVVESLRYALLDILLNVPEPRRDWVTLYKTVLDRQEREADAKKKDMMAKRVAGTRPSLALAEYVGKYENAGYGVARVAALADGLQLEWGTWKLELDHWHFDVFQTKDDDSSQANTPAQFVLNAEGKVEGMRFLEQTFRRRAAGERK